MSTSANVHSLEALETLRIALVAFIAQVTDALTELDAEMRRMLEWLEHDRPRHWKTQLRLAGDQVHEAQQALHRCLMFPIADERPSCYEERAALKKAQARQVYCEEKIERIRQWQRSVAHELFEYKGRIAQLVRLVEVDVPLAIGVLQTIIRRVEDYQSVSAVDPKAAYNDIAMVQEIWPAPDDESSEAAGASGASAVGPDEEATAAKNVAPAATTAPRRDTHQLQE
jgi:hypothetical protein